MAQLKAPFLKMSHLSAIMGGGGGTEEYTLFLDKYKILGEHCIFLTCYK